MLSQALRRDMLSKGIDVDLSLRILDDYNSGRIGRDPAIQARGMPVVDGQRIIDIKGPVILNVDAESLGERLSRFGLSPGGFPVSGGRAILDRRALEGIGLSLLPFTAFGILTGGGATTYADHKRNRALDPGLFARFEADFEKAAAAARGKPKGIVPAFFNPDGSPGAGYLRLKQRALLLLIKEWEAAESARKGRRVRGCEAPGGAFPLMPFHMASVGNAAVIIDYLKGAAQDPLTRGLMAETGCDIGNFLTGVQPMIAAFSHSSEGPVKSLFANSGGRPDSALALPGGHGRNFRVLAEVYRGLRAQGKRYAYLSNVDNLGALPSTLELGIMAATGKKAGFDFSFRSPMDVKGGVLVVDASGRLACGDIGSALSLDDMLSLESEGRHALFNCATGLFDLDWLCPALDDISARLPTRFSDQDKDGGRYSQAEQNSWETIGLLDDFAVFAVEKSERFLSAKMLMETILMSAARDDEPGDPAWETAKLLRAGLDALLSTRYGLSATGGAWLPATP